MADNGCIIETRYCTTYVVPSHVYCALVEIYAALWSGVVNANPHTAFQLIAERVITQA